MKQFLQSNFLIIGILCLGIFLRFYNPLWDNGLFLHPDERLFVNAAANLSLPNSMNQFFSVDSPLNPHMFYYGSLLLYVYKIFSLFSPFSFLTTSRLISAFFSSCTILFIFGIGKQLFSKKIGLMSSLIFAVAAGSIQYAHFNTTESSLIFLISVITYADIITVRRKIPHMLLFSLFLVGIATAIKITGLVFILSPLLATIILLKERVLWKKIIFWFIFGALVSTLIYVALAPYQFIDLQEFVTQQSYMQSVTYGVFKPPFVLIYEHSIPFVYQMVTIFPFAFGFLSFPLALAGFLLLCKKIVKNITREYLLLFLFIFPFIYFAWSATWYAKFERYYLLLLPFLSLWAGYVLNKLPKSLLVLLLLLITLNGLLFFRIYLQTNTRIAASVWIDSHLPHPTVIVTEHWDDSLPLVLPTTPTTPYTILQLPVYDNETADKIFSLAGSISRADYIILSSRRVYVSILNNKKIYPLTSLFYQKLLAGNLGYKKIYTKTDYPFFFSDDFADETFQSYDHPPVLIFANKKHFSQEKIFSMLTALQK